MSEERNDEAFETVYKKVEMIVNKLETENLDLESALKAFEEGQKAIAQCRKMLEDAELKLRDLRESEPKEQN